jgi:hypothetical protein
LFCPLLKQVEVIPLLKFKVEVPLLKVEVVPLLLPLLHGVLVQ